MFLNRMSHYGMLVLVAVINFHVSTAHSQVLAPADTEELRRKALQQEQDRQRQLSAPSVRLQEAAPVVADESKLSAETPCFRVDHFALEIPRQFVDASRAARMQDRFRFADDYLAQYAGQCIGREGLNLIVKRLTAQILGKGYTTTRLGIPEQDLSSGTLKLVLVPGVIRSIRFSRDDTVGSWKTAFPARPGDVLNLRELEQGLEQLKRVPSQDAQMQIVPGQVAGESDVVIDLKHAKPWRLSATLDDSGSKSTGQLQAGFNLAIDNLFGINDLFNIGINNDADNNGEVRGTRGSSAYYSMPQGNFTFTLSAGASHYHQQVNGAFQKFISSGKSDNLEFKTAYLFHRDQSSKSSVQFRTGKRWSHAYINDTEVTVQRRNTTLAELALVHKQYLGEAQLDVTGAYRWGVPWFGAQADAAYLPASSPTFRYQLQTLDATFSMPFKLADKALSYTATFRAQNTQSPLYATEWFAIGNRWTVRGFDGESALSAEKGYFLRNEIGIPLAKTAQTAYVGLDFGRVYGPNVPNLLGDKLAGAALGMRGNVFNGMSYDVFAGWSLHQPQGMPGIQPAAGFNLSYQL